MVRVVVREGRGVADWARVEAEIRTAVWATELRATQVFLGCCTRVSWKREGSATQNSLSRGGLAGRAAASERRGFVSEVLVLGCLVVLLRGCGGFGR